jgi:hypothetical protein
MNTKEKLNHNKTLGLAVHASGHKFDDEERQA